MLITILYALTATHFHSTIKDLRTLSEQDRVTNAPQLYVITGGPGSGKTTVLSELSRRGYRCVPEVARLIIQEQMETGGVALPWKDTRRYAEIMLERSIATFLENAAIPETAFCDRGIPDTLGYVRLIGLEDLHAAAASRSYRYARTVFVAPPWRAIYVTDKERKQPFAEAIQTYDLMVRVYEELGYRIVELPLCAAEERADLVLQNLGSITF
jgi:predicted ATPase